MSNNPGDIANESAIAAVLDPYLPLITFTSEINQVRDWTFRDDLAYVGYLGEPRREFEHQRRAWIWTRKSWGLIQGFPGYSA